MIGCSTQTDDLPRQEVTGTVTLDGQPLESGSIQFLPGNPSGLGIATGAIIESGEYRISAEGGPVAGSYRVQIISPEGGGDPSEPPPNVGPGEESHPPSRERIPARYNAKSSLTADVVADGPNRFDFDLTTK